MTEFAEGLKDSIEVIAPYLQQLAEKIGEGGSYVFKLYVKQAYIEGISYLLVPIIGLVLLFIAYKFYESEQKRIKEVKESEAYVTAIKGFTSTDWYRLKNFTSDLNDNFGISPDKLYERDLCAYATGAIGLCCMISGLFHLKTVISLLANPEYAAIMELIKQLK